MSKYDELNPWCTETVSDSYGYGVWRTIRSLWSSLEENLLRKAGNGYKMKFGGMVGFIKLLLSVSFIYLFSISANPEIRVSGCWTTQGRDPSFRRLLNEWEVDGVATLLKKLRRFNLAMDIPHRVIWKHK